MTMRILKAEDLDSIFGSKDRIRATQYAHRALGNPNTPAENAELISKYVQDHPDKFLSDDEIKGNPSLFRSKRRSDRVPGRVYTGGYSYDNQGNMYDPYGREVGG